MTAKLPSGRWRIGLAVWGPRPCLCRMCRADFEQAVEELRITQDRARTRGRWVRHGDTWVGP